MGDRELKIATVKACEVCPDEAFDPPAPMLDCEHRQGLVNRLWELLEQWYQTAADEMVGDNTRHTYRELANQLDDLLGIYGGAGVKYLT